MRMVQSQQVLWFDESMKYRVARGITVLAEYRLPAPPPVMSASYAWKL